MLANLYFKKCIQPKDEKRLAAQPAPDGVKELVDIRYVDDGHKLHLFDVYRPEEAEGKLPTIVDIHGGAWVYADKELNKKYCMHLAKEGFAVVNLSFRLVPEVNFAGSVKDIFAALEYVKTHADELGIDLDNMFITGDSAGGHTAAMVVASAESEVLQKLFGGKTPINFSAAGFVCAAFNPGEFVKIPLSGFALFNGFYGKHFRRKQNWEIYKNYDFANVIPKNMCPSYFITAFADFLKKQTIEMKKRFDELGIENEMTNFDKPLADGHKLEHVYNVMEPYWEASQIANKGMCDFFKKYVKR